jgi:hypothetical protein
VFLLPELSRLPTPVELASLLNDVPALKFQETYVSPFAFVSDEVPIEKPSELKAEISEPE